MDLRTRKFIAIEQIMQLNEDALQKLETILHEVLFHEVLSGEHISLTQYNEEIEAANQEIESESFFDHQKAIQIIKQWKDK